MWWTSAPSGAVGHNERLYGTLIVSGLGPAGDPGTGDGAEPGHGRGDPAEHRRGQAAAVRQPAVAAHHAADVRVRQQHQPRQGQGVGRRERRLEEDPPGQRLQRRRLHLVAQKDVTSRPASLNYQTNISRHRGHRKLQTNKKVIDARIKNEGTRQVSHRIGLQTIQLFRC